MNNNEVSVELAGDNGFTIETQAAESYADYEAYLELKKLQFSDEDAAAHMGMTVKKLNIIIEAYDPGTE